MKFSFETPLNSSRKDAAKNVVPRAILLKAIQADVVE
jgi:hypothetical protein